MKIKIPHFLPYPETPIMTRQERLYQRQLWEKDLKIMKRYWLLIAGLFVICYIGSLFAQEDIQVDTWVGGISTVELKWPKYTIRVGLQGNRKTIPWLSETTIEWRTKEFLWLFDLKDTFPIWKKASNTYKIDYTLPVCIAFADSHLWQRMKSKNNIGNVGNNDRWDTKEFETLEKWINAIFGTLNNNYLGKYTKVWELSGEGRKRLRLPPCGKGNYCYASSEGVWSTNVTNCLKILKNETVEEDFKFRLGKN